MSSSIFQCPEKMSYAWPMLVSWYQSMTYEAQIGGVGMSSHNSLTIHELYERSQVELRQHYGEEYFEDMYAGETYYGVFPELLRAMLAQHYNEGFRFSSEVREGFIEFYEEMERNNDFLEQPLAEDPFFQTLLKMREDEKTLATQ